MRDDARTCYSLLADFLRYPEGDSEMEELYTRTFDIQALCCLEVGYILFGEDYKRGQLLVKLLSLHRDHDNFCGTDLADHLTNILTLLPKLDPEEAKEFVGRLVLPAVEKMTESFKDSGNPYGTVLQTISGILKEDFKREGLQ